MCFRSSIGFPCAVPPHILRALAERGPAKQRASALNTMSIDSTFRAMRAAAVLHPPAKGLAAGDAVKQRTVYTAGNATSLPGTVVRTEGTGPSGDKAIDEAYDGLGATYDLFWDVYTRNSIDDEGLALDATAHYGQAYDNAFWNGQQMVFGDGDGEIFNRFTISIDVIGHELTHGVTQDEAQLVYLNQSGALNESLSDVFGSLVKQYFRKEDAATADWLIGAGLFMPSVQGVALRSMKAPGTAYDDPVLGKDPQPAHMSQYVHTMADNGGVHINSGIPNKAFHLTAAAIGGFAWEKAGRIWYETLRDSKLRPMSGFLRFARLTVQNAAKLHGSGSAEEGIVRDAWKQVGVNV